jgi:hypothetical protein
MESITCNHRTSQNPSVGERALYAALATVNWLTYTSNRTHDARHAILTSAFTRSVSMSHP